MSIRLKPKKLLLRLFVFVLFSFVFSAAKPAPVHAATCTVSNNFTNVISYVRLLDSTGKYIGTTPYLMNVNAFSNYRDVFDGTDLANGILEFDSGGTVINHMANKDFNVDGAGNFGKVCDTLPDTTVGGVAMPFGINNHPAGTVQHSWALNSKAKDGDSHNLSYTFKLKDIFGHSGATVVSNSLYVPAGNLPCGSGAAFTISTAGTTADPTTVDLNPQTFEGLCALAGTNIGNYDMTHKTFYIYFTVKLPPPTNPSIDFQVQNLTQGTGFGSTVNVFAGDRIRLQWSTVNANACTGSGPSFSFTQSATDTPQFVDITIPSPGTRTYSLKCTGQNASFTSTASITINATSTVFSPYIKVRGGDVAAIGSIKGQGTTGVGHHYAGDDDVNDKNLHGRPLPNDPLAHFGDAQYLVMAAGYNKAIDNKSYPLPTTPPADPASLNFCSASINRTSPVFSNYNLGRTSSTEDGQCMSSAYVLNLAAEYMNPTFGVDLVISNLIKGMSISSNAANGNKICTSQRPYNLPFGTHVEDKIPDEVNEFTSSGPGPEPTYDQTCGSIIQVSPKSNTINGATITQGRGTIWIQLTGGATTLNITDNIDYDFRQDGDHKGHGRGSDGNYDDVNLIPNIAIVVDGNINISGNVTRIDAALYATRKINTCSQNTIASCGQPLRVRGAMLAKGGFTLARVRANLANDPAELVIATGSYLNFPPPGLEDRFSQVRTKINYIGGSFSPKFVSE